MSTSSFKNIKKYLYPQVQLEVPRLQPRPVHVRVQQEQRPDRVQLVQMEGEAGEREEGGEEQGREERGREREVGGESKRGRNGERTERL